MQPQGPANPQGGPYPSYGPGPTPGGQTPPGAPGQPYPGQQYPAQPYQQRPGQPVQPGQTPQPGYQNPPNPGYGAQPAPGQRSGQPAPGVAMPYQNHAGQSPQQSASQAGQQTAPGQGQATGELPPPPDPTATPYDFFMQPKPAQPIKPLPVAGRHLGNIPTDFDKINTGGNINTAGLSGKFPLIAGGGVLLIIIIFVAMALAPDDQAGPQFLNVAQIQKEISRVCDLGSSRAKYRSTRNFAATCTGSVATNQSEVLNYMSKSGYKYNKKQLDAKKNSQVDSQLKSAQSSSTYDETFRSIVGEQLESYDSALTAQLGITAGTNGREVLSKAQSSAQLLIKMVKDDSDKTVAPTISD